MIELRCEYLSVLYIWLYVLIKLRKRFRVNLLSMVAWMPVFKKEFLSGNYRVWIHSKTLTWDDKNIQLTLLMVWLLLAIRLLKIPIPPSSNQHDSASIYSINKTIVQKPTLWIIFQYVFGLRVLLIFRFPFPVALKQR